MFRPSILRASALAAAVLSGSLLVHSGATAFACSIDQKPSVFANGVRARVNPVTPTTQAQMRTWTLFDFPRHFTAHHTITLMEDRRQIARVLMPSALQAPWTWKLGDGHIARGWTVRHTYTHPGRYPIDVYAFNPESGRWDRFDQVTIVIER